MELDNFHNFRDFIHNFRDRLKFKNNLTIYFFKVELCSTKRNVDSMYSNQ